ncbi:SHOCT domain-containing protein [Sphaerisporangium corydalis]|uniref:SHOCT domain-containing protein n=1 Tax=Sphaerisporangium corydalis TaxID=1441875 RepID=A0ABV9EMH4_9ACTN|nr:SHOCT domain-containing protein [Sphaerisporangium corydalis]
MITPIRLVRRSLGTVLGLGGLACCLTLLFLGSRLVMSIGGSCGSGGPYVAATPCPGGLGWIMPVSILGGLVAIAVYMASLLPVGPRIVPLAWPALFLSIGWNFAEAGLSGPRLDVGFLICAVVFVLMGGVPLYFLLNRDALRAVFWGPAPRPAPATPSPGNVRWTTSVVLPGDDDPPRDAAPARPARPVSRFVDLSPEDAMAGVGSVDLVGQLERLSVLHRTGRLDDAEYAAAKARLLNGSR